MLTCKKTKKLLGDYADGQLTEALRGQMDAHMAVCGVCRSEYDDIIALKQALQALPVPQAPLGLNGRLRRAFAAAPKKRFSVLPRAAGATAAALAVCLAGFIGIRAVWEASTGKNAASQAAPMQLQQSGGGAQNTALDDAADEYFKAAEGDAGAADALLDAEEANSRGQSAADAEPQPTADTPMALAILPEGEEGVAEDEGMAMDGGGTSNAQEYISPQNTAAYGKARLLPAWSEGYPYYLAGISVFAAAGAVGFFVVFKYKKRR